MNGLVVTLFAVALVAVPAIGVDESLVDACKYHESLCDKTPFLSYSGHVPISNGSSLFYWYFVPQGVTLALDSPLILWLQGGPGSSSMTGALFEIGPMTLDSSAQIVLRDDVEYSWASKFPMLFVDNPVGTGWSRVTDERAYATNEFDVARDMATFLNAFATLHEEVPKHLIITGESYAGHYIPAIGAHLLQDSTPFKLQGVAIGDGLTDPAVQILTKPQSAFDFGLIDERQFAEATSHAANASAKAIAGDYTGALDSRNAMEELVGNASAINLYDVRTTKDYSWMGDRMNKFFALDAVKDMLHIPRSYIFDENSSDVEEHLKADVMRSQTGHVEMLLHAGVRVLLYQGQFDWKDGASANEAWIRSLRWPGAQKYLAAPRRIWRRSDDNEIAGYWRGYANLEQVVVLGAGHLVPMDAARSAFDMISKFVDSTNGAMVFFF